MGKFNIFTIESKLRIINESLKQELANKDKIIRAKEQEFSKTQEYLNEVESELMR